MALELILKYFAGLSSKQQDQFQQVGELYRYWNSQINIVSRQDIENIYEKHILHSLAIAKVMKFKSGSEILDVGTGGGFPGIPLAILFPDVQFHLIDSIGKKIKVVQEVSQALGLQNVVAQQVRAEQVFEQYDFVVSRAVTRLAPFLAWVQKNISANQFHEKRNGILYLKGGDLAEELAETKRKCMIYDISDFFEEDFFETKQVVYIPFGKQ